MNAPIICDVCGNDNILKVNGKFVCQHCGIKYTLEELRNLYRTNSSSITNENKLPPAKSEENSHSMHSNTMKHNLSHEQLSNEDEKGAQQNQHSDTTQKPIAVTTKDIQVGKARYLINRYNISYQDNTAALIFKEHSYFSGNNTYERYKTKSEDGYRWVYKNKPPSWFDGSTSDGYHGYDYNILDCLQQLLQALPFGSSLTAAKGGEETTERLFDAMNIAKPDWLETYDRYPANYSDRKK